MTPTAAAPRWPTNVGWPTADASPSPDVVFAALGEDRLMSGPDWPGCLPAGSYAQVFRLAEDYVVNVEQYSPAAQVKFFGGNCAKFYGVV